MINIGGDPAPRVNSQLLFDFLHHYGIEDSTLPGRCGVRRRQASTFAQ